IPVIVISLVDDRNKGFALGAAGYLTKPIDRKQMLELLSRYRRNNTSGNVLVIEDDQNTREVITRTLEREGWNVAQAENGRIGLEQLEAKRPDLILLDLMMPEMDGFEFVAAMHRISAYRSI